MLVVAGVAGSGVTDAQTTVLYALSTFAQTCAALAAFVGAVGLYKLRLLADERERTRHNIYGSFGQTVMSRAEVPQIPLDEIIGLATDYVERKLGLRPMSEAYRARLEVELTKWKVDHPGRHWTATRALLILEGWNLLLIGASLVGFSHVAVLAAGRATWWVIWVAGVGTVGVTGYALFAWLTEWQPTRPSDDPTQP